MAVFEKPGSLRLALDPGTATASGFGVRLEEPSNLYNSDMSTLCRPPAPPPQLQLRAPPHQAQEHPNSRLVAPSLARQLRSDPAGSAATLAAPLPATCNQLVLSGVDNDDAADAALNWTDGAAVHCSHAGLTAIPLLPANAIYLYA